MNIEQARFNMIEQQIRPWDVLDLKILDLLGKVPRERFVPEGWEELAFADIQISIGHGEVMMEPKIEARLLQELELEASDKVLEIGTGSGYMTALLAHLAQQVVSVEYYKDLGNQAAEKLARHGIGNVNLDSGDASHGWPSGGGFDAILLTGAVPEVPNEFIDALKPAGRLVAIVGTAPMMEAIRITRTDTGMLRESLFDTLLPPLINAARPRQFVF
ncbi:MAG: protein-L-isoaspartate O-methyltransferase [marine bacterium B5-7]|nr:MAG: protein-L-isoaspartate O-methyltransferase [marine bacterium B5-7]